MNQLLSAASGDQDKTVIFRAFARDSQAMRERVHICNTILLTRECICLTLSLSASRQTQTKRAREQNKWHDVKIILAAVMNREIALIRMGA